MPPGLARIITAASGVARTVVVANGTLWLHNRTAPAGMAYPIDVSAAPPKRYAAVVPAAVNGMRRLRRGRVVLSAGSARLRHAHVGDTLRFGSVRLRVAAIMPGAAIGDAEMFLTAADGRRLGLPPRRYLLARVTPGHWPAVASIVHRHDPSGTPIRLRAPGTARWLREADAVLPPLIEKQRYGEFAAVPRAASGGWLSVDPAWRAQHLVTAPVPILGRVTCNRAFMPQLRAALRSVVAHHLQHLINPRDYGGCWAPRLIPGLPGDSVSHHAYGSALDINVSRNEFGGRPHQDPRLVKLFREHGITWGGSWLVPDGMHFEALSVGPTGQD